MAAPKTINEYDMALHAHREMGGLAEHLDYSVEGGSYSAVVNAALADYGVAETSGVKGVAAVALMLACTRYALWRQVTSHTNIRFNISSAGDSLSLSQINDHARASMAQAKEERNELRSRLLHEQGGGGVVGSCAVTRADDPYSEIGGGADEFSR